MNYTEASLVQEPTADYLEQQLSWESVFAYHNEDLGPGILLGRASEREVVLTRKLREKLVELNPGLPDVAYDDAVRELAAITASQDIVTANREKYEMMRDGVQVAFRNDKGEQEHKRLRVFDFDEPANNHFYQQAIDMNSQPRLTHTFSARLYSGARPNSGRRRFRLTLRLLRATLRRWGR